MVVDLKTLEIAFGVILKYMNERQIHEVEINDDFYWFIPEEERYDSYQRPTTMTIGQLTEDWENVRKIASGESRPVGLALRWLAAILIPVGERSGI